MTYTVNQWGSHPDLGNDDCHTGADYPTLVEARAAVTAGSFDYFVAYIELKGPDVHEVIPNPKYNAKKVERESRRADDEWKHEQAMQAGMAFGVDGYNDEMGY